MDPQTFSDPPPEYRAAPFWAWNGDLNVDETRRQVRDMAEHGFGGAFMHARLGLRTEYLGERWFENCAASIEEGRKVGFFSWLYDEDRYPSGHCGGRTAAKNPDFRSRELVMQRGEQAVKYNGQTYSDLDCLARFQIVEAPGREPEFHPVSADARGPDIISFHSGVLPANGWYNGGHYPDLLHDGAVREFIKNTYEPYAARFREHFGKAVPGVFTDEPCTLRDAYTWSVRIAGEFRKRRGYDLIARLPALFFGTPDAAAVRHDYWKTVHELFHESFMVPIGQWCAEHQLALTGHLLFENGLEEQIRTCGGVMWHYVPMQVPGIDILAERLTEVATCKQASSVCNQFDKPLLTSELYGCTGYNFSFEGQKWIGDWQMALGVNFLCQHLTHYTMKGDAKRDYPPSYGYQSPWWRHYRHVADYQARLCCLLRQGRAVRDILVVHPLTGAWCAYDPASAKPNPKTTLKYDQQFDLLMRHLLSLHRDFDLGDEMIMAAHGSADGREMVVGSARYPLVIVAPTCNLESSTVELLERYAQAGGKLVFVGEISSLVDGRPSDRVKSLAGRPEARRAGESRKELEETLDSLLPRRVSVLDAETDMQAPAVVSQQRKVDEQWFLFLANNDRERGVRLKVSLPVLGAWERWDCETGEVIPMSSVQGAAGGQVELFLPPAGSVALVVDPKRPALAPKPPASVRRREKVLSPRGGWSFRRVAPNSLVLDRCAYRIGDEAFSREILLNDAQEEWRKRFGLLTVRDMTRATQPWKRLQDPENLKPVAPLALRYTLRVDAPPRSEVFLVIEDRADFEIRVNGSPVDAPSDGWFMDRSFEKVPIGRLLKRGDNVLELRTTLTAMRLVEDVYIIGDFSVDAKSFALGREPKRLAAGDWCPQGYPFYTDAMMYETRFRMGEDSVDRVSVELPRFEGTVAAVWVNGERAAVIGWRPYEADVTRFVRPGENRLGIEIVGSPRNLMGPRHLPERYPPWTGPLEIISTAEPSYQLTPAGLMGEVRLVRTANRGKLAEPKRSRSASQVAR
jgi:hypothetical protein